MRWTLDFVFHLFLTACTVCFYSSIIKKKPLYVSFIIFFKYSVHNSAKNFFQNFLRKLLGLSVGTSPKFNTTKRVFKH